MGDTLMVMLTVGVGVVLLVVLVLLALPPVRRFKHANAALRTTVADRIAALRAAAVKRRRGSG